MGFGFTRKTDYALVALAELELHGQAGALPVSARHIADEYELPLSLLMNVMKELNRAGLIVSKRGAAGGYELAKPADALTVAEVIEVIEGPVAVSMCCEEREDDHKDEEDCLGCRLTEQCPVTGTMKRFNDLLVMSLHRMTLADMMSKELEMSLQINRKDTTASPSQPTVEVISQ